MNKLRIKGQWWRPSNPEICFGGELRFSQKSGATLELNGGFRDIREYKNRFDDIILGRTDDNKLVTLETCTATKQNANDPYPSYTLIKPHGILIGQHFENREEIKFQRVRIELSYLRDWMGKSGFRRNNDSNDGIDISYENVMPINAPLGDVNFAIHLTLEKGVRRFGQTFNENAELIIHTPIERSIEYLIDKYANPFKNFLNLGSGLNNFFEKITFDSNSAQAGLVELFYKQSAYKKRKKKVESPHEMLFDLEQIEQIFQIVMIKWLSTSSELEHLTNLFGMERRTPHLYTHLRLLTIIQAIEYYHERRYNGEKIPKAHYKSIKRRIKNGTPTGIRKWISSTVYGNQKSLRDRLTELLATRNQLIRPLVPDIEKLISTAVATRNFYAHTQREKDKAVHGEGLFWLTEIMSILLQACLLDEIGIPLQKQVNWFNYSKKYYLIKVNSHRFAEALARMN